MSQLIECYTEVLQAAGLTTKEDGSVFKGDERFFVKGKPLMLPLPEVLKRADVGEKLIFHPFAEAANKGESDTLEAMRERFALQLNVATAKLVAFFLQLGSGELKTPLDPEQMKVMRVVKDVAEKDVLAVLEILKATTKGEGKRSPLTRFYLSRKPNQVGDVKYFRTCVVTFPLYTLAKEELQNKTKGYSLLGVSTNAKALKALCGLIEFIFPGIDKDPETYNQGSTSQIAPFADALLRGVGNLYSIFNEKVQLYKDVGVVGALQLPTSWIDVVDRVDSLFTEINRIPLQPNADGKARLTDVRSSELAVNAAPQAQVVQQPNAVPAVTQVAITPAPQMVQHHAVPMMAPVPAAPEPEYIKGADDKLRKNPNFMRPAIVGTGVASNPLDPFNSGILLPSNAPIVAPPAIYGQQYAYGQPGVYQQPAFQQPAYQQPGMYPQQMVGGRLPGLPY